MSFKSLLTQKCDIQRKTVTKTGAITSVSYSTIKTDVKCRIRYYSTDDPILKVKSTGFSRGNNYLGFFFADENIQEGDRILWNSIYLYARPVVPIFGSKNKIHHLEVVFGLEET